MPSLACYLVAVACVMNMAGSALKLNETSMPVNSVGATEGTSNQPSFLNPEHGSVTASVGDTVSLNCRIQHLGDKTVSWVRRQGNSLYLLTFGFHTYHNDLRYSLRYEDPENWKLQIRYVKPRDEGVYECQISTHPPKIHRNTLTVKIPEAKIQDSSGSVVTEAFYRVGSSVDLQCIIMPAPHTATAVWSKEDTVFSTSQSSRIWIESSKQENALSMWLRITHARISDSGDYVCSIGKNISTRVRVHILKGESSAAMQHSATDTANPTTSAPCKLLLVINGFCLTILMQEFSTK